jgi:hypothetical protein
MDGYPNVLTRYFHFWKADLCGKNLQYQKKVVPLHPLFGKSEASDDVNTRGD